MYPFNGWNLESLLINTQLNVSRIINHIELGKFQQRLVNSKPDLVASMRLLLNFAHKEYGDYRTHHYFNLIQVSAWKSTIFNKEKNQ